MEFGFNNGEIKLNHTNNVYYSGQIIKGDVVFKLQDPEKITALNIQFLGLAKVLWSEVETEKYKGTTFKARVDYKGQEQYFNEVQNLMEGQNLKPATYTIPFEYQIPATAPSSYKAEKGEVAYEVRAYLEYSDVTKERGELVKIFEVVAPLDLIKDNPRIKEPLKMEFEEQYKCGCAWRAGALRVEVAAGAGAAGAGQALPVAVRATNDSRAHVHAVTLQLLAKTRYRSQNPVSEVLEPATELARAESAPVPAGAQRNYDLELLVPDLLAPNLNNCSIIDVQYFLKATVKLSGCNNDLVERLPFYIALKPVNNFGKENYVHPMAHSLPPGPIPDYPIITANQKPKDDIGFKTVATTESVPQNTANNSNPNPNYNYNQTGYPNQPPNVYPVLNFSNNHPNAFPPSHFPGYTPVAPVNYSPSAPPM